MLGGLEIKRLVESGEIVISPFREHRIGPNSYNLSLGNRLLVYELVGKKKFLSVRQPNPTREIIIPSSGMILEPNVLYLGETEEYTETYGYVPTIEGRSSIARLGMFPHVSAGVGDNGYRGKWTLEIYIVEYPVEVYPGMEICQIMYTPVIGNSTYYNGKYQGSNSVQPSKIWKEYHVRQEKQSGD